MAAFSAVVELSDLDGADGFKISGEAADDFSGFSVSGAGDVNGDGFGDLIVGARGADPNGSASGASYVVFGSDQGFAANFDLSGLEGPNGFQISGEAPGDFSGTSVSGAGDVNGDGIDDLIVGAWRADLNGDSSGASYVVFGSDQGFAAELDLSGLEGPNGFQISGEGEGDFAGFSVAAAGDVNGDGFDDIIVGAYGAGPNGPYSGASHVVFGSDLGFAGKLSLSGLEGPNGFQISGEAAGDFSGTSVSGAGDVNGDGVDDLIVGARDADPNGTQSGASYVVFGSDQGFAAEFDLATLDGSNGFQLSGEAAIDFSGFSVSGAGDVNGDGFADLIVGAWGADSNGYDSGASYVVFGSDQGFAAELDLSDLDGANGFQISGEAAEDEGGFSVSGAGDVNGDGFSDLIVGANSADPDGSRSGASYVVFGSDQGFAAELDLSDLDGTNGFQISGEATDDFSGWSVSSAGDVNGDGVDDLVVGAPGADPNGSDSGASYVIFGIQADLTIVGTPRSDRGLIGRSGDDTISGLAGRDVLSGGAGDDTLIGGLGRDILLGGEGADTFVYETWRDSVRGEVFDSIRDFSQADGDRIDLSGLPGTLTWRGDQPFTGQAGEVRFFQGPVGTYVVADRDGDEVFDLKIWIGGRVNLTQDDFIL